MSIQSNGANPNSPYARVLVTKLPFPAALHKDACRTSVFLFPLTVLAGLLRLFRCQQILW
jgi:hypothetical protein